jgi:hypothetical protein
VLQRFDVEMDQSRFKFDLERDEAQRKFLAALWGVELKDAPAKTFKSESSDGKRRTMTAKDIMRNYAR